MRMATPDPSQPLPVEPGPSTRSLVLGVQAGSREALEDLYRRYLPRLRRWASGRLPARGRGAADTEDLVQDVLMRTLHRIEDLRPEGGGFFQSYTRQALLHAIANQVRNAKERAPSAALAEEEAGGPSPLEELIGREAMDRYERGLARLDPQERELVACRLELRMSWEEIARELEKPSADAARMATKRAVARLAREMSHGNA
jgi:RNA polymerase sigma factor (sigma-70 family)